MAVCKEIMFKKIEFRVRSVTRYIVTMYEETDHTAGSRQLGDYSNEQTAYDVAYALCRQRHGDLGWAPGDERIQYPFPPPPSIPV